ncbi:hypothetical protein [Nostoc sp.]|uniref:hypothetical protein n=1 Tax=Nostoc sp. TaxID=1180 RepID=UPI002FF3D48C
MTHLTFASIQQYALDSSYTVVRTTKGYSIYPGAGNLAERIGGYRAKTLSIALDFIKNGYRLHGQCCELTRTEGMSETYQQTYEPLTNELMVVEEVLEVAEEVKDTIYVNGWARYSFDYTPEEWKEQLRLDTERKAVMLPKDNEFAPNAKVKGQCCEVDYIYEVAEREAIVLEDIDLLEGSIDWDYELNTEYFKPSPLYCGGNTCPAVLPEPTEDSKAFNDAQKLAYASTVAIAENENTIYSEHLKNPTFAKYVATMEQTYSDLQLHSIALEKLDGEFYWDTNANNFVEPEFAESLQMLADFLKPVSMDDYNSDTEEDIDTFIAEDRTCPECGGCGEVWILQTLIAKAVNFSEDGERITCGECNGEGRV